MNSFSFNEVIPEEIKAVIKHYWKVYNDLSKKLDSKEIKEIEFENRVKKQADNTSKRILEIDSTYTQHDIYHMIVKGKDWI